MNKKISEIGDRAKTIFKLLVENYISTGEIGRAHVRTPVTS